MGDIIISITIHRSVNIFRNDMKWCKESTTPRKDILQHQRQGEHIQPTDKVLVKILPFDRKHKLSGKWEELSMLSFVNQIKTYQFCFGKEDDNDDEHRTFSSPWCCTSTWWCLTNNIAMWIQPGIIIVLLALEFNLAPFNRQPTLMSLSLWSTWFNMRIALSLGKSLLFSMQTNFLRNNSFCTVRKIRFSVSLKRSTFLYSVQLCHFRYLAAH